MLLFIKQVTSHNGVSLVSRQAAAFAEIRIKMTEDFPPKMVNVTLIEKDHQSVTLRWDPARIESGNPVIYDVIIDAINLKNAIDFPTGAPRYFQVSFLVYNRDKLKDIFRCPHSPVA